MKRWKFAAFLSFVLFFCGCATMHHTHTHTHALPPAPLHPRPVGFWENGEMPVVYIITMRNTILIDASGSPVVDSDGNPAIVEETYVSTGGVVDVNGLVVTNNHVVDTRPTDATPQVSAICQGIGEETHCTLAEVLATDPESDLALLRTDQVFPLAVEFGNNNKLKRHDEVYFWGCVYEFLPPSPFSGQYIGTVGPPYYNGNAFPMKLPLLLLDISFTPGSSGAPIFNKAGKVIGWVSSYINPTVFGGNRPPGVAIPANRVKKFWKDNAPPPAPKAKSESKSKAKKK